MSSSDGTLTHVGQVPSGNPSVARWASSSKTRPPPWSINLELCGVGDMRRTHSRVETTVRKPHREDLCEPRAHVFPEHSPHTGPVWVLDWVCSYERKQDPALPWEAHHPVSSAASHQTTANQHDKSPRKVQKAPSGLVSRFSFPVYPLLSVSTSEPHPGSTSGCHAHSFLHCQCLK